MHVKVVRIDLRCGAIEDVQFLSSLQRSEREDV